ncbi:hypothetical protein GH733_017632 [Mirounga leonina]|nr:hypothetical protein GH733_017632 [Mirounga leonina]
MVLGQDGGRFLLLPWAGVSWLVYLRLLMALPRALNNEANTLYDILMEELIRQKEASMPGNLSEEEKMFLLCFPLQKFKLEKSIRELHAIADQVDATHKMLTKTSLVASSSGTISGVMSLLGLALAPVTVGGSLMLSEAGLGLGAQLLPPTC